MHSIPLLFLVSIPYYKCAAPLATRLADHRSGRICQPCIRHYPNPGSDLPMPKQVTIQKNEVTIFRPVKAIDFLPSIHLLDRIAVMHDLEIDDQCYKWMWEQGWSSRVYEDHLGGWHQITVRIITDRPVFMKITWAVGTLLIGTVKLYPRIVKIAVSSFNSSFRNGKRPRKMSTGL